MPASELPALLAPRDGVVRELASPSSGSVHHFGLEDGPVASYSRVVSVSAESSTPTDPVSVTAEGSAPTGLVAVRQEVRLRVGVPYVSWLFAWPLMANLGGLRPGRPSPWWAPPQRLAHREAVSLAGLCGLAVVAGYLASLLPATMTYIGREYHVGDAGQGYALAGVQVGAVLAIAVLVRADRRGRRGAIVTCTLAGAAVTVLGAAGSSLVGVAITQVVAIALVTAQYVLLGVMVVEQMPAGTRAWALALLTMSYGLGGGGALLALPLAGLGPGGWRWTFLLAGLGVPLGLRFARHVPESDRWRRAAAAGGTGVGRGGGAGGEPSERSVGVSRWTPQQRRRLLVLGAGFLLFALFATPAGQFQNQYLRVQRHWTAVHISVAEQIIGTVGGLGTLAGGRLADTRGRRPVLLLAIALATAATVLAYFTRGVALYGWFTASSLLGYAVAPALAVYGGELFPTSLRGRAGGILTVLASAGGIVGLVVVGAVSGAVGTLGPALAVVAVGPALLVVLIAVAYPETARRALEELNPSDAPVAAAGRTASPAPAGDPLVD